MTPPGDGQNLGPGWCPAAPRPDLGKGRPWVTHECEELKKQIARCVQVFPLLVLRSWPGACLVIPHAPIWEAVLSAAGFSG